MKANELRIGNLVNDAFGDVSTVNPMMIANVEIMKLQPIPLTEEWLIKFGYNKLFGVFELDTLNDDLILNCTHENEQYGYWFDRLSIYIKHVHQFQNLYFALKQEELTL